MSATLEAAPSVSVLNPVAAGFTAAAPATPPAAANRPLRLTVAASAAARRIGPWVARGVAVRKRRVRDRADLDAARGEKSAWVKGYADALREVFDGPAVADACTDWAGRILPEYAPVGLFVEQFYEEMDHRLRRLQTVVDHLEDMAAEEAAAPAPAAGGSGDTGGSAAGTAASARIEPKGRSLNWARLFPAVEELAGRPASPPPAAEQPTPGPVPAPVGDATGSDPAAAATTKPPAGSAAPGATSPTAASSLAAAALQAVVKPVGLVVVRSADDAKAVVQFLTDLAVAPRVVVASDDADFADPEALTAGAAPPTFALIWPPPRPAADPAADGPSARFAFQLGFLVGRLGAARVCLVRPAADPPSSTAGVHPSVPTLALDAHGGWQLPLARTLRRAGVQVDLNRLC